MIETQDRMAVCIIGLGYVGLTLAVTMASLGFHVVGVEKNKDAVKKLKGGKAHFFEPGLDKLVTETLQQGTLQLFEKIPEQFAGKTFIITVGTPLNSDGQVNLTMIKDVSREVSYHLKDGDLVILRSTVKVGTTENLVAPILEKSGKFFDLAFCPERTLEGAALKELRYLPQIIGGISETSTKRAQEIFLKITQSLVSVSDASTAEMIKLVDNSSRDLLFAFSNEIAVACDTLSISATEVIQSASLGYSRTRIAMPGPVGGPCLEKDPYILCESTRSLGFVPRLAKTARQINEAQPEYVVRFISEKFKYIRGSVDINKVSVLGIAFKGQPLTSDTRGTMALPILEKLKEFFPTAEFYGFDPLVPSSEIINLGFLDVDEIADAFEDSDLVIIANNNPMFSNLDLNSLSKTMSENSILYDFWNNFYRKQLELVPGVSYFSLGSHRSEMVGTP